MKKHFFLLFLLAALCLFLSSCLSSTRVIHSWTDSSAGGYRVKNVLIIGVSRQNTTQRLFEDTFVEAFRAENIKAAASYKTAGWDLKPERQTIEAAIAKSGAKAVLITRVVNRKTKVNTYPGRVNYVPSPQYRGMYGYYGYSYRVVHTPPITRTTHIVCLESNLYDVATEKLIWSAQSKVIDPEITEKEIQNFVKVLMDDLRKYHLI